VREAAAPRAAWGVMREASAGKDTITGHWEMAGLVTTRALATFPNGFPREITAPLATAAGRGLLGNKPASGTAIIDELGPQHMATGDLILYTSADSVLQIAAHEQVVPLRELYQICEAARAIADRHQIGRVIARPFVGQPGAFKRTYNRRDFALVPPAPTLLDHVRDAGQSVVGIGKISDIFAGRGVGFSVHSEGNTDGLHLTLEALATLDRGLLFVNLVDFDMLYGHRNDTAGFARALVELDRWLPSFEAALRADDVAFITADHGNDPTTPGTDHTREQVPLLAFGPAVRPARLGTRTSFCDLGQTIAEGLGVAPLAHGESFLSALRGGA
jgi:phosphopentomutase